MAQVFWHSRGYLPHFESPSAVQFVTFRLADSLPKGVVLEDWSSLTPSQRAEQQQKLEAMLDECHGSCLLRNPGCAELLQSRLLRHDGERYKLYSWVIMPNHVHALLMPLAHWTLSKILQEWKGGSAFEINRLFGASGRVWQPESFDRFIRDYDHFDRALVYIEHNPVKAALASCPEGWTYSSAGQRLHLSKIAD